MAALKDPQYEKFASELAELKPAIEAYKLAGFAPHRGNANRLAKRPEIKARVAELLDEAAEYADIRRVRVLVEIDRVGRANVKDFYNGAALIPIQDLPRHVAAAIKEVQINEAGTITGYIVHDKNQANFTLLKHLGGLPEPERNDVHNIFNLLSVEDQRVLVGALENLAGGKAAAGSPAEGEPVPA